MDEACRLALWVGANLFGTGVVYYNATILLWLVRLVSNFHPLFKPCYNAIIVKVPTDKGNGLSYS